MRDKGSLVGSAFDFEPGDPSLITSLCVTLCRLSLSQWIQIATLNVWGSLVEYQLCGVNHGPSWKQATGLGDVILKTNYWLSDVEQDYLMIIYADGTRSAKLVRLVTCEECCTINSWHTIVLTFPLRCIKLKSRFITNSVLLANRAQRVKVYFSLFSLNILPGR